MSDQDGTITRVLQGASEFQLRTFRPRRQLFERLSQGQQPHTCFITCSDSRIDPQLLTGCEPGELFVIRNAGNLVPNSDSASGSSEAATIEFALTLGVRDLILCGHSHCGLVKQLLGAEGAEPCSAVESWMQHAEETRQRVERKFPLLAGNERIWAGVQENVLVQLEHLRSLPAVAERLATGDLKLHGWIYCIETGEVLTLDEQAKRFVPLQTPEAIALRGGAADNEHRSSPMPAGATMSGRILVIEDEAKIVDFLLRGLREEGYQVEHAADGPSGWRALQSGTWDLVLLDWWLPGEEGIQLLQRFRRQNRTTPVLFLTARDGVSNRVAGLDAGADDYLCKPFAFDELLARMRALLRRPSQSTGLLLEYADIRADLASQRATRGGVALDLTAKEFSLLCLFLREPGKVLSRTRIYEAVWGDAYDGLSNTIEVHVKELRRKLEELGPRVIQTRRGRGYVLDAASADEA